MIGNKRFTLDDENDYIIFDNNTITDMGIKELYWLIDDDQRQKLVDLLNELHEENNELRLMLNSCSDQRSEFHRGARENANRVGKLKEENKQLKTFLEALREELSLADRDNTTLEKENEQLKKEILWWKYRCGEDISGDVE